YPQNNGSYEAGKDVYVKVDPKRHQDIEYMELYIDNKFIRKESQYPYEWCVGNGSSDSYLRNMPEGTYKLKCKFKDKCGDFHEIYCTFYVKGHNGGGNGGGHCNYTGWFKYPECNKHFEYGSDVYVYFDAQNHHNIDYCELYVNNKFVRKESQYPYEWCQGSGNSDGYLRDLEPGTYELKCRVYDKCGDYKDYFCKFYVDDHHNGGNNGHCENEAWFKYPQNNASYDEGKDVYVKVDPKKHQDVEYMELYVNNKFVRKESQYPYEWCVGNGNSDSYLRDLPEGTYNLKCRVRTKCGEWYEYFCKFYVK
ncbi:MAG: hypothetical protein SFU99_10525, partial [Saprospiraceae bacterium]|nr:hypothetical protein [Saprospiraceae bacterium]